MKKSRKFLCKKNYSVKVDIEGNELEFKVGEIYNEAIASGFDEILLNLANKHLDTLLLDVDGRGIFVRADIFSEINDNLEEEEREPISFVNIEIREFEEYSNVKLTGTINPIKLIDSLTDLIEKIKHEKGLL